MSRNSNSENDRRGKEARVSVAHLDHSIEPGGAELALLRMVDGQTRWDAHVFVPAGSGNLGVFRGLPGDMVHRVGPQHPPRKKKSTWFPGGSSLGIMFRVILSAVALALSPTFRSCDVVHANTSRAALYGALATKLVGKPMVVHLRDRVEPESLGRVGALIMTWICQRNRFVVANSRATLSTIDVPPLLEERPARRVLHSHVGMLRAEEPYPTAHDRVRDGQRLTVGMVARLDPWKGQTLLLEALSIAHKTSDVEFHAVLVGGGAFGLEDEISRVQQAAERFGVGERLTLTGHVEDVVPWIDGFDVCVQASLRPEPMGQNVLQYMTRGRVVVVANEGGPAELIDDGVTGMHFSARDAPALSRVLVQLAHDTRLRARLAAAALSQSEKYTGTALDLAYSEVFEECAGRQSACA